VTASAALSDRTGGSIVLKAENMQRTGSFKIRGAMNKLASLGELARNGVTAGSAGNTRPGPGLRRPHSRHSLRDLRAP